VGAGRQRLRPRPGSIKDRIARWRAIHAMLTSMLAALLRLPLAMNATACRTLVAML
jgi:hypothetical protein